MLAEVLELLPGLSGGVRTSPVATQPSLLSACAAEPGIPIFDAKSLFDTLRLTCIPNRTDGSTSDSSEQLVHISMPALSKSPDAVFECALGAL